MEKGIFGAGFRASLLPVLNGHLQCNLDCGRAVVRIEDARKSLRRDPDQLAGQLNGRRIGEAEKRRMGNLVELLFECTVQNRMPMSMEINPDGGGAIEIFFSLRINKVGTFAALDNQQLLLFPFLHLGKRMPEIATVPVLQLANGWFTSHGGNQGTELTASSILRSRGVQRP